jgi:hypothetical protein
VPDARAVDVAAIDVLVPAADATSPVHQSILRAGADPAQETRCRAPGILIALNEVWRVRTLA